MNIKGRNLILSATSATDFFKVETLQNLWSGYGSIDRYKLIGSTIDTIIVKHVRLPEQHKHPRGWNTHYSHQRKLHSYEVETTWYEIWANQCNKQCRVPHCYAVAHQDDEVIMILEDLDSSGYPARKNSVTQAEMNTCLNWLAHFHALNMCNPPRGLWETGTYWHLDTRPEELQTMEDGRLKQAASQIDKVLNNSKFQTIVHGDAKLANFCFSEDGKQVAAVDFQYVGGGCGMKDIVYFISSCLDESECESQEQYLLDNYFKYLGQALSEYQPEINPLDVEQVWRPMYEIAWTDFYRFLKGWSPGHWKIHRYSERLAEKVVNQLCGSQYE